MAAVDTEIAAEPVQYDRIAMIRAQLEPIRSRRALLDLYQRESLCRLASTAQTSGSAADVLDLAYALRWLELEADTTAGDQLAAAQDGLVDE